MRGEKMETLSTNIESIRNKYGENIEKMDVKFCSWSDEGIADIRYNKITDGIHEYTIEKLSNIILLPVDTKIYVKVCEDRQWTSRNNVVTFALFKPERIHKIECVSLMGGGYAIMDMYTIDIGDKIKFVTLKEMGKFFVTFKNVLGIKQ